MIGEAESSFLHGEVLFEIVYGRFAWSTVLESSLNGQELVKPVDSVVFRDE